MTDLDPRGLIRDAYAMEKISGPECRTVFLDWAMSRPDGDERAQIDALLAAYGAPDHPMTQVLREGLSHDAPAPKRRGGALGRRKAHH
ncbi:MAG: hypothetical protein ACRBCL_10030 [Maritimibacter sp.]